MKVFLASLLLVGSTVNPMLANSLYNNTPLGQKEQRSKSYRPWRTASDSQAGYSSERKCFKTEYREEYVPGTEDSPGYVKSWKDTVEVTCEDSNVGWHRPHRPTRKPYYRRHVTVYEDTNDCSDGTAAGAILGGGLGAVLSRGDGRWWAIPTGVVTGAMLGCQIDGG
jgi:hypothetical protein